jgi:hypothetical protein
VPLVRASPAESATGAINAPVTAHAQHPRPVGGAELVLSRPSTGPTRTVQRPRRAARRRSAPQPPRRIVAPAASSRQTAPPPPRPTAHPARSGSRSASLCVCGEQTRPRLHQGELHRHLRRVRPGASAAMPQASSTLAWSKVASARPIAPGVERRLNRHQGRPGLLARISGLRELPDHLTSHLHPRALGGETTLQGDTLGLCEVCRPLGLGHAALVPRPQRQGGRERRPHRPRGVLLPRPGRDLHAPSGWRSPRRSGLGPTPPAPPGAGARPGLGAAQPRRRLGGRSPPQAPRSPPPKRPVGTTSIGSVGRLSVSVSPVVAAS